MRLAQDHQKWVSCLQLWRSPRGSRCPLGSWLVDKTPPGPRKAILLPAGLVQCAAFGSLALATSVEHFYASMALQGFCSGFIQPAISSFTAEVTEQRMRGQAMSLQREAGDFMFLAGPIALGARGRYLVQYDDNVHVFSLAFGQQRIFIAIEIVMRHVFLFLVYMLRKK